jgi:hypothetical protein
MVGHTDVQERVCATEDEKLPDVVREEPAGAASDY